jgi:YegS/Rv2252/BmrU family lipid kinase
MPSSEKIAVIVNPRSAHGRTGKRWPAILAALQQHLTNFEVFFTERAGHGTELTRQALRDGFTRIVSVGGDGTHFEVSSGFFDGTRPVNPEAVLAILPHGTGSDLARSLRLPRKLEAALPHLVNGRVIRMDVARITCRRPEGGEVMCHFLNTSRIGMGGEVVYQVNRNTKAWGGFFSYCWAMLKTLFVYTDKPMRIEIDGKVTEQVVKEIIVANGQYDGGGMHVAPDALLNDGLFDIYIIGPVALWDALRSLPLIYRGGLMKRPDVISYRRGWVIRVDSPEEVKINTDGEVPGMLPATIELLPAAIRVVAGKDAPLR